MFITRMFRNFSSKHKILQNIKISIKSSSSTLYKNSASNAIRPYGTVGVAADRFLNPTNDIAFQRIFGLEKNKSLVIDFLNSILSLLDRKPVINVQFLSSFLNPEIFIKRECVLELLCRDSKGTEFILEMQLAKRTKFEKRAPFYAANFFARQTDRAGASRALREVIFIGITDFIFDPNSDDFKSIHTIREKETNVHSLKGFYFIFLELPKFNKDMNTVDSLLNKWMYFLKYANDTNEKDVQSLFKGTCIEKAFEQLNRFNWSAEELFAYYNETNQTLKQEKVLEAAQNYIRKEIALNMIKKEMPFPFMMEITGLNMEELKNLMACSSS